MLGELIARLEQVASDADRPAPARKQAKRAASLMRYGLVPPRGIERWLADDMPGDVGRYLVDRFLADEAALDRELLCRSAELDEEPPEVAVAKTLPANVYGSVVRLQKIGESPTGIVWKGWDMRARRLVSLRVLRPDATRYLDGARVAMGIVQPNVACVLDVGRREAEGYVVSELVTGVSLRAWAMQHGRQVGALVSHIRSVARALHRAHERGYLHLALKPENILVAALPEGDQAYVSDFGMRGDTAYFSPEQFRGAPGATDGRGDVYSLGATLYAALAGHPPHARPGAEDAAPSLRGIRADIPDSLAATVSRCLEKETAKRFASMRELDAALLRTSLDPVAARTAAASVEVVDLTARSVQVPKRPDIAVVDLVGSLTTSTLTKVQDAVRALRPRGVKHVVLDLLHVRFISSGGFGYLIQLSDELRLGGGAVALAGMRKHVQLVYESLGLDAFFQVVATRDEAVRRMAPELSDAGLAAAPAAHVEETLRTVEIADLGQELNLAAGADAATVRERGRRVLWRIEMLLRADERDAQALTLRGRALVALGDVGRGELELRRGGDAAASALLAREREAVLAAWKGTPPDRTTVEAALTRDPKRAELHLLRGLSRRAAGDLVGALQDLNRATELRAGYGEAFATYALVLRALGDRAQCAEYFERSIRVTPPDWPLRPHVVAMAGAIG